MKGLSFILIVMLFSNNLFAQESMGEKKDNIQYTTGCTYMDDFLFEPDRKLLNQDIWTRICVYRFESAFLRLVVVWNGREYLLKEMDGEKRILAKNKKYPKISQTIIQLTLK